MKNKTVVIDQEVLDIVEILDLSVKISLGELYQDNDPFIGKNGVLYKIAAEPFNFPDEDSISIDRVMKTLQNFQQQIRSKENMFNEFAHIAKPEVSMDPYDDEGPGVTVYYICREYILKETDRWKARCQREVDHALVSKENTFIQFIRTAQKLGVKLVLNDAQLHKIDVHNANVLSKSKTAKSALIKV